MNTFRFKSWILVRIRGCGPYAGSAWRIAAHVYRERAINCMDAIRMQQADMHTMQEAYADIEVVRDELLAACEAALEAHDKITEGEMNGYGACRFCGAAEYPVDDDGDECEAEDATEWRANHADDCVSAVLDTLSARLRTAIAKAVPTDI